MIAARQIAQGALISFPDWLAVGRVLVVPVIMALTRSQDRIEHALGYAAALFTVAAITDFLDGYLARRWHVESVLGAFLDTTADKLLVTGTLLALTSIGRVSIWAALVIMMREFAVLGLRGLVALGDQLVTIAGRVTMDMTMVVVPRGTVRVGDRATFFGGPIPLDAQAERAGTISYELLTAVGPRVVRRYHGGRS